MKRALSLQVWLTMTALSLLTLLSSARRVEPDGRDCDESDRGDVPGWVMITVMTVTI